MHAEVTKTILRPCMWHPHKAWTWSDLQLQWIHLLWKYNWQFCISVPLWPWTLVKVMETGMKMWSSMQRNHHGKFDWRMSLFYLQLSKRKPTLAWPDKCSSWPKFMTLSCESKMTHKALSAIGTLISSFAYPWMETFPRNVYICIFPQNLNTPQFNNNMTC